MACCMSAALESIVVIYNSISILFAVEHYRHGRPRNLFQGGARL